MERLVSAFGLVILLAACQIALPGAAGKREAQAAGIAAEVIEVTALDAPASPAAPSAAGPAAKGAASEVPPPAATATGPTTDGGEPRPQGGAPLLKTQAWIACEKRGGIWERAAAGAASFCQMPTRDGGKQCRRSTDCEGYCLARSGTCAPITPLLGCQDILNENGRMLTQCIN